MGFKDFLKKTFSKEKKEQLDAGLEKTKQGFMSKISRAIAGKNRLDEEVLDDLEEAFFTSDVGFETTSKIVNNLKERVSRDKYVSTEELTQYLCEEVSNVMTRDMAESELEDFQVPTKGREPYVILVVGVNGVGKTTTIAKLAHQYIQAGNKVFLGAADTYRAAAIDQLQIWGDRTNATVIKQKMGSDPAAVAFDTVSAAKAQGADVVIIDTAGRLHNKIGLMNELTKIKNSVKKVLPDAPQEVLLILDGTTGQNAIEQARQFIAATEVNCLAVTKLDGTARGGVVIGISDQFKIPVKYIGIGEKASDLQIFHPEEFARSLFGDTIK